MQTLGATATQPSALRFSSTRIVAERPSQGTDQWARVFMASLAIVFLSLAGIVLWRAFAQDGPAPRLSRTFCKGVNWDSPVPFRNCFTLPQ
jgi:hypothetical protein